MEKWGENTPIISHKVPFLARFEKYLKKRKKMLDFCRQLWYSIKRASDMNFSRAKNNFEKNKKTLDKNVKMRYNK